MARFYGKIGYSVSGTLVDGVWSDDIIERAYYGTILNETRTHESAEKVNDDIRLTSRISVVADLFAFENYANIKYVKDQAGAFWEVTSVELKRPRLVLSTGGVYHGSKPQPEEAIPDGP